MDKGHSSFDPKGLTIDCKALGTISIDELAHAVIADIKALKDIYNIQYVQAPRLPHAKYKLAMSVGDKRRYRIVDIVGRHFVQTGKEAGIGPAVMQQAITDILERAETAADKALAQMPKDFAVGVHESVRNAISMRIRSLEPAIAEIIRVK